MRTFKDCGGMIFLMPVHVTKPTVLKHLIDLLHKKLLNRHSIFSVSNMVLEQEHRNVTGKI